MKLDYSLIGSRVNDLRKSRGISQERLAELADLSTTFISHIERNDKKPSLGSPAISRSTKGLTCRTWRICFPTVLWLNGGLCLR